MREAGLWTIWDFQSLFALPISSFWVPRLWAFVRPFQIWVQLATISRFKVHVLQFGWNPWCSDRIRKWFESDITVTQDCEAIWTKDISEKKILVDSLKVIPRLKRRRLATISHGLTFHSSRIRAYFLSFVWSISLFHPLSETNESTTFDQTVVHIGQRDHGKIEWFTIDVFFWWRILQPVYWFWNLDPFDFLWLEPRTLSWSSRVHVIVVIVHPPAHWNVTSCCTSSWKCGMQAWWCFAFCFWCFVFFVFCWVFGSSTWILGGRQQYCTGTKTAISQVLGAPIFSKF